jgi:hypothetical protein
VISYIDFIKNYISFKNKQASKKRDFPVRWSDRHPCLNDKTETTHFDAHYVYHLAWAARILGDHRPAFHVDISSSLHFCTIVSAFIPVKFYDYRPADLHMSGLTCDAADLLALPFEDRSVHSLSCMHVVEHVGLGRYGDPLDPDADLKAISELKRVLSVGSSLLFVVPVGKAKIMFNAHRIYSYQQIVNYFSELHLQEFSLIPDDSKNGLIKNATEELADRQTYGCGCFWFKRR